MRGGDKEGKDERENGREAMRKTKDPRNGVRQRETRSWDSKREKNLEREELKERGKEQRRERVRSGERRRSRDREKDSARKSLRERNQGSERDCLGKESESLREKYDVRKGEIKEDSEMGRLRRIEQNEKKNDS